MLEMEKTLSASSFRELFSAIIDMRPRSWTTISLFLFAAYFVFAVSYMWFGGDFAKLGVDIPKPAFMGNVKNTPFKLYMFEMLLLIHIFMALFNLNKTARLYQSKFLITVIALLLFGFVRLIVDLKLNPMLGIRNSSFVWYMLLSTCIALISMDRKKTDYMFMLVYAASFFTLIFSIIRTLIYDQRAEVEFSSDNGAIYPFIAWYFLAKSPRIWLTIGVFIAVGIGFQISGKMSRTAVLGILLLAGFMLYYLPTREALKRIVVLGIFVLLGMGVWQAKLLVYSQLSEKQVKLGIHKNPLIKTTEKKLVENYRFVMWKQAVNHFLSNPVFGIGFQEQVVKKIYVHNGIMYPNDGTIATSELRNYTGLPEQEMAPVSGPHNSYLNALARLGAFGAFFVLLHAWGVLILLQEKLYFCAFALGGQAFYAVFNVGLEGPIRSFMLIVALGVVMQCCIERVDAENVGKIVRQLLRIKSSDLPETRSSQQA